MDLLPVDLFGWIISFFTNSHEAYFRVVPTADPNVTFAMSFAVFFLVIFYNIRAKGFGLFKEILSAPFGIWLFPLNIFFRLIDEIVKPISLSLRLFGNIFAGELDIYLNRIVTMVVPMVAWWYMGNIPYIDCINPSICVYDADCSLFKYGAGSSLSLN